MTDRPLFMLRPEIAQAQAMADLTGALKRGYGLTGKLSRRIDCTARFITWAITSNCHPNLSQWRSVRPRRSQCHRSR